MIFHVANCFEEGDEVVMFCMRSVGSFDFDRLTEDPQTVHLFELRFNLQTGKMTERHICKERNHELPSMNIRYLGRKNRYSYLPCFPSGLVPDMQSVEKWDLEERCMTGRYHFGGVIGEVTFVPRNDDPNIEEDDGFLVVFVYKEERDASSWTVLNARTMELKASIDLPCRVPAGFHGWWVDQNQLATAERLPSPSAPRARL